MEWASHHQRSDDMRLRLTKLGSIGGILFLILPLTACAHYKVYYLPIETQTLAPVGLDDIEQQASLQVKDSAPIVAEVFDLQASKGASPIQSPNLRAKIVRQKDGQVIYLDQSRGLLNARLEMMGNEAVTKKLVSHLETRSQEATAKK